MNRHKMSNIAENNRRIAKNTIYLYARMLVIMVVSLFTSRIVLNALGVVDYGIYNVVGGVVSMVGLLKGAMASATTRYINFELGRGDDEKLRKTFSVSVMIYAVICGVFLLIAETVGLWFVNAKLTIPAERMLSLIHI